ncbi:hypothetical protein EMIHUDRAFT_229020 [Emiliania huxleyi CCMP1516]|uniref:Chromosome segregation in meiosis protein 3 domain-containing protein n=2 Tax=Emiliania huxleyi TaxID=2903 RepID=A0A0D3KDU8_EMIH1|nr:hypothetical protein EMIHUDRAFT_229020 [Emiliania huxleyi CCMP1516]EOD33933.1 hypothetical protein EMIHUDRAFT_229020 [Emiliania huxleyi CCMP1516]|eukprot:XP_005786362.1 hypothetical protein EMIHUDRAFT_229020 [Emiliania huxleyi CCMP1516]
MDNWDDVLNDQAPGGVGGDAAKPADDGVLVASSKFAAKCRSCSKTIDVGAPAWFQRSGEPGRKTTCKKRKVSTRRKPVTKLTPEMLLDPRRGIVAVYREFSALKVKSGSKHAPAELRRVLAKYAEWAHALLPDVEFGQFVEKLDKVSQRPVLHRLAFLRDVQQGVASLDDLAMEEEAEGVDSSGRAVREEEFPDADDFPDAEDDFDDDAMAAELGIDDFDDEGETQDYGAEDGGVEDGDDGADALSALDESAQAAAAQRAQALAEALALDEEGL